MARISVRTMVAIRSTSDGSQVLARPIGWGKTVAPRAMSPAHTSS